MLVIFYPFFFFFTISFFHGTLMKLTILSFFLENHKNLTIDEKMSKDETPTATATTPTPTPTPTAPPTESAENEHSTPKTLNFSTDDSLSLVEKIYDLVRRNEDPVLIGDYLKAIDVKSSLRVNEILKNGDTLLCLCCNKNLENLVRILVESFAVDINLCRSLNVNTASFSTVTPTVTITARRQSRLISNPSTAGKNNNTLKGDSPLSICIKYGYEPLGEYLIESGANICGSQAKLTDTENNIVYADFEKSPLQEAIRLSKSRIVEKMFKNAFERDDLPTIEWIYAKRYDILRQVLMSENLDTIKVILPNIIENGRIDGEMLIHILNYLLMKSKIQERKEKVNQIIETVMEIGSLDDGENASGERFEIFNLDIFVRGFFGTLKALFNTISSEDSRTAILSYRTSLFFFIMKYQKPLINFDEFYPDIDSTFDYFYTKMKETGENIVKLVEYFITFYDTLITMDHIHLTAGNVKNLLRLEHVKKIDILGDFLIQRSLMPLDLKELSRLKVKMYMRNYNLYNIVNLPVLDEPCRDFLFFMAE